MKLNCSGYLCGNEIEFNPGKWNVGNLINTNSRRCILEITTKCEKPLLTRMQIIQLRDFLSDLIAQTYVEHYFDHLED